MPALDTTLLYRETLRAPCWNVTLLRRDRRYRAAAISVAAKRLGLGAGAKRFNSDSPYLFERSALRGE